MKRTKVTDEAILLSQDAAILASKNPDHPLSRQLAEAAGTLARNPSDTFAAIALAILVETFKKSMA